MKLILTLLLTALPVSAVENVQAPQELAVPMDLDSSTFDDDVESVSSKLRRLLWETRRAKYTREINSSIARKDPESAQKALDALASEYPELKKQEPHAFEYHQGSICFWRRDFGGAHDNFDAALKALEKEFPNGVPPGGKYSEINASFMSDLYMGRGTAAMHQGRDAEAIKDMNRAILVSPKPRAYMQLNRCRALIRLKRFSEAAQAYSYAYRSDPGLAAASSDRRVICEILSKNGFPTQACQTKSQ